ncbi:MAG: CoA transferase [Actinobacteria bacterium]|nr:CoA transferase [Actinomycetota bacterium]
MTAAEQRSPRPGDERAAWAASGAMYLTGRRNGPPLAPPAGFVRRLSALGEELTRTSSSFARPVDLDVLALLGERAAIAGFGRNGAVSCGGAARLLPTADGWLAVNLPRPDDLDLVPAWLGIEPGPEVWPAIAAAVETGSAPMLAERARLLGLPVAALTHDPPPASPAPRPSDLDRLAPAPLAWLPLTASRISGRTEGQESLERLDRVMVVDLSCLWAGPLCTHLLQQAGARVVKVESVHRPDGARSGPAAFFDLLHAGQEAVAIDFRDEDGRAVLRQLIEAADVVVEGSRPRALEQLGVIPETVLARGGSRVWVSITGYGRSAPGRDWVAFGDDAAVAGGLVAWDGAGPCFLADAIADPCAGIVAAAGVLRALAAGGSWLLDVSMRHVAAHLAGPDANRRRPVSAGVVAEAPRARPVTRRGPSLGEHTEAVLAEIRIR